MSVNGRHVGVVLTAVGVLGLLLWLLWPRRGEPGPAPPNPFVKDARLERVGEWVPLGDVIEIEARGGFYVSPALAPGENIPQTFEGRKVQAPAHWTLALVLYPLGSGPESKDALRKPCVRYKRPGKSQADGWAGSGPNRVIPIGNAPPYAPEGPPGGFSHQPEPPKDWPQDELRYWTYFGLRRDAQPGQYVYELTLYPTAAWTSSVRCEFGPSVVLRRGRLHVVDPG